MHKPFKSPNCLKQKRILCHYFKNSIFFCGSSNVLGNKVYVHPISGDLQQCTQKLGYYNQTTCPGGTVCERFPILIPGFQVIFLYGLSKSF